MANPARLMLGIMMGLMPGLATATAPAYGSQAGNPDSVPRTNMSRLSEGASIMAQAVAGEAGIGLVSVIEFDIV